MNERSPGNVVVLSVDRLSRALLGAYGNSWIQTPNFDRLAAEGFLFDSAVIDSPQPELFYRSCWQGWHALAQQNQAARIQPALARQLVEAGYSTLLVSDEAWMLEHPAAGGFGQRELIQPPSQPEDFRLAASVEETHCARLFAASVEALTTAAEPFCLWLHTGLLGQLWDAPLELRERYRDADDPQPADLVEPPDRFLPDDFDPDDLLAIVHAYAGQVSLLDMGLGQLLDVLAASPAAARTMLVFVSPRGFPLGEHGRVGPCNEALYAELTNVPLAMLLPDRNGASERTQALVQPADLHATILDWCGRTATNSPIASLAFGKSLLPIVRGAAESVRDRACTVGLHGELAIATPAWSLRMPGGPSESQHTGGGQSAEADQSPGVVGSRAVAELFAKPDDWFEANEVSDRCREVPGEMEQAFRQFEEASRTTAATELPPLAGELMWGNE